MTKAARPKTPRQPLRSRVRVLPLTILAVALLLGLKIGAFWQGRAELFVTPAGAQQAQPAPPAATGQPTQLTPPRGNAAAPAAQTAQASQTPAPQTPAPQAPAAATSPAEAPAQRSQAQSSSTPAAAVAPSSTVQSLASRDPTTYTRAEIELLANLAQRREVLEQRAREIDLRESLLAAAEKRIDERIAELKKLEGSIKQIVQQYDKQEEQNLQGLVKVYENMKPKDAARIFEKLDANVLLGVVERMKETKLAAVLADMPPTVAQEITVRLATRKQIPPTLRAGAEAQTRTPAQTPAQASAARTPAPAANAAPAAPATRPQGG